MAIGKRTLATAAVAANVLAASIVGSYLWEVASGLSEGGWRMAEAAVDADQVLVNTALALSLWMCVRGRLAARALLPVAALGVWTYDTALLISGLHSFLLERGLYPESFRHAPGATDVNSQYAMLVVAAALTAGHAARVAVPRWRTFDRGVTLAVVLSVWATGWLFHHTARDSIEAARMAEAKVSAAVLEQGLGPDACAALKVECADFARGTYPALSSRPISVDAALAAERSRRDGGRTVLVTGAATDADPAAASYGLAVRGDRDGSRVVASMSRPIDQQNQARVHFGMHAAAAHLTWLAMGAAVILFHSRLPAFRRRREARELAAGRRA